MKFGGRRSRQGIGLLGGLLALAGLDVAPAAGAPGRAVRLWPNSVVVDDLVRVRDVAELRGFDATGDVALGDLPLGEAPQAGGSRIISLSDVRAALSAGETNMATLTLKGAAECIVRRPASTVESPAPAPSMIVEALSSVETPDGQVTLRDAVTQYFDGELSAHGARSDLQFGRTSEQILELTGPPLRFHVQRRSGSELGLVDVEVEVRSGESVMQRVPLVVSVAMMRDVLAARTPINKGAAIEGSHVVVVTRRFTRLEDAGLSEPGEAVGLRAKRFIAGGEMIQSRDLERVPLVKRGQMVEVVSRVGGITIKTAAKAADDAGYGDAVTLHVPGRKRDGLVGRCSGPRRVELNEALRDEERESVLVRGNMP